MTLYLNIPCDIDANNMEFIENIVKYHNIYKIIDNIKNNFNMTEIIGHNEIIINKNCIYINFLINYDILFYISTTRNDLIKIDYIQEGKIIYTIKNIEKVGINELNENGIEYVHENKNYYKLTHQQQYLFPIFICGIKIKLYFSSEITKEDVQNLYIYIKNIGNIRFIISHLYEIKDYDTLELCKYKNKLWKDCDDDT